ncbi:SDR family oxidoreductase [Novosphingobium profundi]|uniref:SDR family NAD(P)-dependent oxidoreductase n=1 Tax=Novosphingobium profundi TaxID=1774954 RepID=UPI001BD9F1E0|nr:SDR family NAD(P)-dependent oxidoreductase [Novosphingobium profundi]MBT0666855.1 SDR family oxidoreductase [Novosphingobium profundi]
MELEQAGAAVITGGASGLGAATARALVARDVKVALFDRDAAAGEALAAELGALYCAVDVTDETSVLAGFARARETHGQERILVNCAGIAPAARTVGRDRASGARRAHDMALFEKAVAINLSGTFRCVAHAATGMVGLEPLDASGARGVIVNTASIAAQDGQVGQAAYAASKGGVAAMTLPLARDLMDEGIRVNAILPGIFETPMVAGMPQAVQDALAASIPCPKRLGRPDEYAELALFLIASDYLNGECIRLDGAVRMGPR